MPGLRKEVEVEVELEVERKGRFAMEKSAMDRSTYRAGVRPGFRIWY